jgi:hypothetical protein
MVSRSVIRDSILDDAAQVEGAILDGTLLGRSAVVRGRPSIINAGDDSVLDL